MKATTYRLAGAGLAVALVATSTFAFAEELKGLVVAHEGSKLVVQSGGVDTEVMLTDATKIQIVAGVFGAQRKSRLEADLIPGLAVTVETVQNGGQLDAEKITFKNDDLKNAMAAQAAMAPAKKKLEAAREKLIAAQAETERRLSQVGQFEEKGRTRVFFATGKTAIDDAGKKSLRSIASQAMAMPGASLRVVGFADSTGNATINQRLSNQRASNVTAYLVKACGVPHEKILSPSAMGATVANDAPLGNAQDRRVTVMIMVSKAASGTSHLPQQ
ncbi:MAG TPA: OmpA family protein [Caulobacteraceae bacterium]|jgi:outer membrane protein OmpA-like peptidoglycan-associated protein